jgi:hypothetical protein
MKLEYRTLVTVAAETEEEAKQKASDAAWDDDGMSSAELVDWSIGGRPSEDK